MNNENKSVFAKPLNQSASFKRTVDNNSSLSNVEETTALQVVKAKVAHAIAPKPNISHNLKSSEVNNWNITQDFYG